MTTTKRKRCPNGSRRNKKTGLCEENKKKTSVKKYLSITSMSSLPFSTPKQQRSERDNLLSAIRKHKKTEKNLSFLYTPHNRRTNDIYYLNEIKHQYVDRLKKIKFITNELKKSKEEKNKREKEKIEKIEKEKQVIEKKIVSNQKLTQKDIHWFDITFDFLRQMYPNPHDSYHPSDYSLKKMNIF